MNNLDELRARWERAVKCTAHAERMVEAAQLSLQEAKQNLGSVECEEREALSELHKALRQ